MKIEIEVDADSEDCRREKMTIDGKEALYVRALALDCPEDATLERSLVTCCQVATFMQRAWEVGKAGEPFDLVVTEAEPE